MTEPLQRWRALVNFVNATPGAGTVGLRDPDYPCYSYDGEGYNGRGRCDSDGHYECNNCSHLSEETYNYRRRSVE